jgi:hypothetical protein
VVIDAKVRSTEEQIEVRPPGFYDLESKLMDEIRGVKKSLGEYVRGSELKVAEDSIKSTFSIRTDAIEERIRLHLDEMELSKSQMLQMINKRASESGYEIQLAREVGNIKDEMLHALTLSTNQLKTDLRASTNDSTALSTKELANLTDRLED